MAEASGDLIFSKITYKTKNNLKNFKQNNSEIVTTNDYDKEIPKDIYIYIYI